MLNLVTLLCVVKTSMNYNNNMTMIINIEYFKLVTVIKINTRIIVNNEHKSSF